MTISDTVSLYILIIIWKYECTGTGAKYGKNSTEDFLHYFENFSNVENFKFQCWKICIKTSKALNKPTTLYGHFLNFGQQDIYYSDCEKRTFYRNSADIHENSFHIYYFTAPQENKADG